MQWISIWLRHDSMDHPSITNDDRCSDCWMCRMRNPSHNRWQPVPITANCILMDLPFQWGVITIYPVPYTHFLFDHSCVSSSHLIHVICLCLVWTGMLIAHVMMKWSEGIMLKCFVAFCYGEILIDLTLIHQDYFTGTWQSCYCSWILWSNQLCESTADDHKKSKAKQNPYFIGLIVYHNHNCRDVCVPKSES